MYLPALSSCRYLHWYQHLFNLIFHQSQTRQRLSKNSLLLYFSNFLYVCIYPKTTSLMFLSGFRCCNQVNSSVRSICLLYICFHRPRDLMLQSYVLSKRHPLLLLLVSCQYLPIPCFCLSSNDISFAIICARFRRFSC